MCVCVRLCAYMRIVVLVFMVLNLPCLITARLHEEVHRVLLTPHNVQKYHQYSITGECAPDVGSGHDLLGIYGISWST